MYFHFFTCKNRNTEVAIQVAKALLSNIFFAIFAFLIAKIAMLGQ